jgi:acetoacetyl-CoA synthetase
MSDLPLWAPSPGQIAGANVTRFIDLVNRRHGLAISGYHPLWKWSVENLEDFWTDLWDFAGVIAQTRGTRALVDGDKMPGARFFPDAKLNFAENLLRRASGTNHEDGDAIIFWGEDKVRRRLTHRELRDAVSRMQQALAKAGVKEGDRVAAFMPNMPETVVAMLATASLGADLHLVLARFRRPGRPRSIRPGRAAGAHSAATGITTTGRWWTRFRAWRRS